MRRHFFLILSLTLCLLVLAASSAIFWHIKTRNQKLTSPIFREDLTQTLSHELEQVGLALESAPMVLGQTVSASISGYPVLFSKDEDLKIQVRALQLVLPRLKMDNKKIVEIDLRFNKVVIR